MLVLGGGWRVVNWWVVGGWWLVGGNNGGGCGTLISRTPYPLLQHLQSLQEMMMENTLKSARLQAEHLGFFKRSDLVLGTNWELVITIRFFWKKKQKMSSYDLQVCQK